jgi:hypothetical protein
MSWVIEFKYKNGDQDQIEINAPTLALAEGGFDQSLGDYVVRMRGHEIDNTLGTAVYDETEFKRIWRNIVGQ